jgi:hypothetical protein
MTYRCGIGPGLPFEQGPPHVRCDTCGLRISAETKSGGPTQWLLKRKAPKGWMMIRRENEDGSVFRRDYCPSCRASAESEGKDHG